MHLLDDSAPANVSTGVGGLDASIGFETLRTENSGAAMNDTVRWNVISLMNCAELTVNQQMGFFANYTSAHVSSTSQC